MRADKGPVESDMTADSRDYLKDDWEEISQTHNVHSSFRRLRQASFGITKMFLPHIKYCVNVSVHVVQENNGSHGGEV